MLAASNIANSMKQAHVLKCLSINRSAAHSMSNKSTLHQIQPVLCGGDRHGAL